MPGSQQDVAGPKRDHDQTHDEVGTSQRGDEEVGDGLEPLEAQDGCDHQHVTWTQERVQETFECFPNQFN